MPGYNLSPDNFQPTRVGAISMAGCDVQPSRRNRRQHGRALTVSLALCALALVVFGLRMAG